MAKDAANDLSFFVLVNEEHRSYLGHVRNWDNLKVGFDERGIWIKNLDYAQLHSLEVKTIPQKQSFYEKDGRLFPVDSLLPAGNVPGLLWTPIDRALPVSLPSLNHNYFGLRDQLIIGLEATEEEQEASAMVVLLDVLIHYAETAPAVRFRNLKWTMLGNHKAIVFGTPLLPIDGEVLWNHGAFLLPVGFRFELSIASEILGQTMQLENGERVIWNQDGTVTRITPVMMEVLSLSSLRLTFQNLNV